MTTERTTETLSTDDLAQRPDATDPPAPRDEATASEERAGADAAPLVEGGDDEGFRTRWDSIQAGFVDEPRRAVEEADALVAELMQRLAETFSNERKGLEGQWDRGEDVSTEDLRVALTRYRSFFDRLLAH